MNEMYCTQCGHDPLLQADNDRRNKNAIEKLKRAVEIERAEVKRLTEQMEKLAHLANEKNAAVISEMYIADWDAIRAETSQARAQLAVARARIAELENAAAQLLSCVSTLLYGEGNDPSVETIELTDEAVIHMKSILPAGPEVDNA